jgi:beta-galactosidase/beta-glucuronidase
MVYEAKRYVYFLQQLWHWKPNAYQSDEFCKLMKATQANPQLQKEALQQLFAYFGEELTERDFLRESPNQGKRAKRDKLD